MLQGTASHVGKSILTAALCRIFFQDRRAVAPFKAQNMALNSFVTREGLEMGRAQVAQAEAAGIEPRVAMNPVLLKPTGNSESQVIIDGRPVGNMSAREYHTRFSLRAFDAVKNSIEKLREDFDTLVIEGAGSPAEVNLRDTDIVNMRVAKYLNAPVILVADIDRGGALASIVGTLELLEPDERDLVKALIINKFRGDLSLFTPAVEFLESKTHKPVLGVIPFIPKLGIDDEDSVSLDEKDSESNREIKIAVIRLPKISNFTDFDSFEGESDVSLKYCSSIEKLDEFNPDVIILPGSKNTIGDLEFLNRSGIAQKIREFNSNSGIIFGICGGYQMLGQKIFDPNHVESNRDSIDGFGFFDFETTFAEKKITRQVSARHVKFDFMNSSLEFDDLSGYEIHSGISESNQISTSQNIFGTYIHGIFDNDQFRREILNLIRFRKDLPPIESTRNIRSEKQRAYDRLASIVRDSINMDLLYKILEGSKC